jgi:hypothetical protein
MWKCCEIDAATSFPYYFPIPLTICSHSVRFFCIQGNWAYGYNKNLKHPAKRQDSQSRRSIFGNKHHPTTTDSQRVARLANKYQTPFLTEARPLSNLRKFPVPFLLTLSQRLCKYWLKEWWHDLTWTSGFPRFQCACSSRNAQSWKFNDSRAAVRKDQCWSMLYERQIMRLKETTELFLVIQRHAVSEEMILNHVNIDSFWARVFVCFGILVSRGEEGGIYCKWKFQDFRVVDLGTFLATALNRTSRFRAVLFGALFPTSV